MTRTARAAVGGNCYHVLNRGNARADVFHMDGVLAAFLKLIADTNERLPMRVLTWRVSGPRTAILSDWPIACPARWVERVNRPQSAATEKALSMTRILAKHERPALTLAAD